MLRAHEGSYLGEHHGRKTLVLDQFAPFLLRAGGHAGAKAGGREAADSGHGFVHRKRRDRRSSREHDSFNRHLFQAVFSMDLLSSRGPPDLLNPLSAAFSCFLRAYVHLEFRANTINVGADLAGMADAAEMLTHVKSLIWVFIFAVGISWATVRLRYYQIAN